MTKSARQAVVLTTAGRGGILSVVETLERDGLGHDLNPVVLHTTCEGSIAARLLRGGRSLLHFIKLLLLDRVAIVHCHVSYRGSFWRKTIFALFSRMRRVPVIFHMHGSEFKAFYAAQLPPLRWLIRKVLQSVDKVIVLSESWKVYLLEIAPEADVIVVPNYVDASEKQQDLRADREGVNLLFLGVLGKRKGIYDLLPAFAEVAARHHDVTLYVGGNGELEKVRQVIADCGFGDRVHLLGWVQGEQKQALLARADVFVLPSYNEGLPVSVLEAMSHGMPVISTTVGGIPQLVRDGEDGFLIAPGDVRALSERLEILCSDAALRQRMGAAARERVKAEFSRDAVLPRLHGVYAALARR